jgi:HAMP domain-containing protein
MSFLAELSNSTIALGAAVIVLIVMAVWQEIRISKLLRGRDAVTLEDVMRTLNSDVDELKAFQTDMMKYCELIENRMRSATRGVGIVRFDAFSGIGDGGRQSFAVALLDERGDGVVFSSILSRDRARVFAKPIRGMDSEHELTDEEAAALTKAKESCKVDRT